MTLAIIIAVFVAIFLLFIAVAKLLPGEGTERGNAFIPLNPRGEDDNAGHE